MALGGLCCLLSLMEKAWLKLGDDAGGDAAGEAFQLCW